MALSAAAHHSFDKVAAGERNDGPRAQKTDSAGEAANKAPRRQKFKAAGEAVIFELFDEDTAGLRPGVLAEPRPQERVQQHTMEHIVDFVCCSPMVQILDAPVPQMVELLPDVLRFFDRLATVPEQAIEVPVPFRAVLRDPQLAEQLVEVPTIVSYSSLQRNMEQNVDIPVPGRGGRVSGLRVPDRVQQRRVLPRNAFLSGLWSRSLIFLVEAFKIFALDRVYPLLRTFQLVLMMLWMRLVMFFFALFPKIKKSAKLGSHSGSELLPESSPSSRRAYAVPMVPEVAAPVLEGDSEDEDPDRWRDELGRLWMRSALDPRKWYLLGTGLDVDNIWEEPG